MVIRFTKKTQIFATSFAFFLVGSSLFRIHVRVKTTMIGYEIGRVKKEELELKERNGELSMLLAKVSSLKYLKMMIQTKDLDPTALQNQVALK
jgi:hypothetical protein